MTQPYPYLVLADDIDTITLSSGTGTPGDITLQRRAYSPPISGRRPSRLGGQGPYEDVVEELDINIRSTTVAGIYAYIERINQMIDRADQWMKHPFLQPVTWYYAPQGSTISLSASITLRAIVLGRAPGDRAAITLPPNFTESGTTNYLGKVRLRFLRRSPLAFRQIDSSSLGNYGSTSTAANPTVHTITMSGGLARTMAPMSINVEVGQPNTMSTIGAGILVMTSATNSANYAPNIEEAEGSSPGTGYSVVADSANNARGGNVLRYTPAGTTAVASNWLTTVNMFAIPPGPSAIILAVRNNTASRTFWLRVEIRDGGDNIVATPMVQVPAGTSPQLIRMGIVTLTNAPYRGAGVGVARVVCQVDSTSGSPTLDIDYICTVPLFDETCRVIQHDAVASGSVNNPCLVILNEPVTERVPRFGGYTSFSSINVTYPGTAYDALDLQTLGDRVNIAWLATSGTSWRYINLSGTVVNTRASALRSMAYMGPQ